MNKKQKIGLVLGGGGGKGAYQIGVWKALREYKVDKYITYVSGTSIGSLNSLLFLGGDLDKAIHVWSNITRETALTKKSVKEIFFKKSLYSRDGFIELADYNQLYYLCEQLRIYKSKDEKLDSQAGIQFNKLGGDQVKKDDLIATIYSSQKISKDIINTFIQNIKYYDKREQFTIKNYLQDVNDNLNLIKVNRDSKNKE